MKISNIKMVHQFGQSVWLDYFDRWLMDSCELERLIVQQNIGGITSNPTIFEKAISGSLDYDNDIRKLSRSGLDKEDIFYAIAIMDIQRAADILKPVFNESGGEDGYVSLEVSPLLAMDARGTIEQARKLWKAINRANLMIKIPSTKPGLVAIQKCISEGININVTLIFGLNRYNEVISAYVNGIKERLENNLPVSGIYSVASFFLSRLDVMVDPILEERSLGYLKGETAIACAKKAYRMYKEAFYNEKFRDLSRRGTKPQRILWASTSNKDPLSSDVKYVEALIGKETINTITRQTMEAFNHHGHVASHLEDNLDHSVSILAQLWNKDINMDDISLELEKKGIEKFISAHQNVLSAINTKSQKLYA